MLPNMSPAEEVLADYRATGLSLRAHPMTFLRQKLNPANLIVRPGVWKRHRQAALGAAVLVAHGKLQRQRKINAGRHQPARIDTTGHNWDTDPVVGAGPL